MSARPRTTAARSITFAALLLLAFALRTFNLTGESLWRDEVDIIRFTLNPVRTLLTSFTQVGFNGPLYLLLMRPWLALAGVNDFALRYFSLLCGLALIALAWALARRWVGRRAAWAAAWLLAVSPVHIWYAGEGKMYTLQPALLVLALYALARVLSSRSRAARWWAVFIVTTSCAFYVHILSPVFLVVAAAVFIVQWPAARTHLKGAFVALACLTLPYVPLLVWQFPTLLRGSNTGHTFYPPGLMAQVLLSDWSFGFGINAPLFFMAQPVWVRWACVALFAGLAVIGLMRLLAQRSGGRPGIGLSLLAWLMLPPVAVYAISTRAPVFEPRYLLWCAPALYMLAGAGLMGVRREHAKSAPLGQLALVALTLISLLGLAAQVARPIRPDMRAATRYVSARLQGDDTVTFQIPYGRYGFEYYLAAQPITRTPQIIEAPYTNYGMSEAEVDQALRPYALPDPNLPARNLWLIELEPVMWDARGLVRRWFDASLPLVERREFNGITVSLYRPHTP